MTNRSQILERHTFPADWTPEEIHEWLAVWKQVREAKEHFRKVVFVSGAFDLLHEEHRNFLQKARKAGNFLIVGIDSDHRVRETKGPDRPIQSQQERLEAVLDTGFVDEAAIIPEAFYKQEHYVALMQLLKPHILAVSSHSAYQTVKRQIMELIGGELMVVHEHNPAISTTVILQGRTIEQ